MKLKISKRSIRRLSSYTTLTACAAALWMFVVRFEFPVSELIKYTLICFVFLILVMVMAGVIALIIRKLSTGSNKVDFDFTQNRSDNEHE